MDQKLDIATGKHRRSATWNNQQTRWPDLVRKLSTTHRTAETLDEYMAAKKPRQDEIKDIGGFVGGYLANGRRKTGSVVHRQILTLDADFATPEFWSDFTMLYENAACIYSTHKHSPKAPRLRLLIPLSREVFADEYTAIARKVASVLGIDQFDPTSFRPTQFMYWPSSPKDAEYLFDEQEGPWLDADEVLNSYTNWKDASEWPLNKREQEVPLKAMKKQGDPLEKDGPVGAFCKAYTIYEAIEKFLTESYEACDIPDRYTYIHGSTSGGLVIYEGKFAFSHHGTDPISGKLCNAFDLVRLHKFYLMDEDVEAGTPEIKKPSFKAMLDFVAKDPEVRKQIGREALAKAQNDFDDDFVAEVKKEIRVDENDDWMEKLDIIEKTGQFKSTVNNVLLILQNDPNLRNRFAYDEFEKREIATRDLPWRKVNAETRYLTDNDDSAIRYYIEKTYGIVGLQKILDGFKMLMMERTFHPVRDYLESLEWDGEYRLDTLFVDYMGAEDSEYTRAVARKWACAAVARIYSPGCKFDYMPVLIGPQGKKKSMIPDKLGRGWFSDSLTTMHGKESFEQLQGVWIVEIAELSALRNAEVETAKQFISKREDRYRVAYGRRTENFSRQCVFIGTSNDRNFLKDKTGNRRFWPVDILFSAPAKDVYQDLTDYEAGQIWAEARHYYRAGELLYLTPELEEIAYQVQAEHETEDPLFGLIQKFLETPVPLDWAKRSIIQRRNFLFDSCNPEVSEFSDREDQTTVLRTRICAAEIFCELLRNEKRDLGKPHSTRQIIDVMRRMPGWKEAKSKTGFGDEYGTQRWFYTEEDPSVKKIVKRSNSETASGISGTAADAARPVKMPQNRIAAFAENTSG